MKNKKAIVFGETKSFDKTFEQFEQNDFKTFKLARQCLAKSEVKYVG